MLEPLLAFFVLVLIMAGMAVGVVLGKPPLKGSCGGVGAALNESDYTCDLCGDDPNKCDELFQDNEGKITKNSDINLAYDASSQVKEK
ncbi:MAG: hypothetical protein ACI9LL_000722 [Porticoccus sp.]